MSPEWLFDFPNIDPGVGLLGVFSRFFLPNLSRFDIIGVLVFKTVEGGVTKLP